MEQKRPRSKGQRHFHGRTPVSEGARRRSAAVLSWHEISDLLNLEGRISDSTSKRYSAICLVVYCGPIKIAGDRGARRSVSQPCRPSTAAVDRFSRARRECLALRILSVPGRCQQACWYPQ